MGPVQEQELIGSQKPRLVAICVELGIRGVYKMSRKTMIAAIIAKQDEELMNRERCAGEDRG